MLRIPCPHCGPREEDEFRYAGEGVAIPDTATDAEWARVLYHRSNPAGPHTERWMHVHGCRQWFYVLRDTRTHAIIRSWTLGEPPKEQPA